MTNSQTFSTKSDSKTQIPTSVKNDTPDNQSTEKPVDEQNQINHQIKSMSNLLTRKMINQQIYRKRNHLINKS